MHSTGLEPYKVEFIEKAMEKGVLLFGEFTLKSGRQSPYFFNAGLLYSGSLISRTAQAFAAILANSRIPEFDVLFGPAYKGISLAAITAQTLYEKHGRDKAYCYNRKEKKDHGEGGDMVGAPLKGKIVIIDDVLTSGKAIREAIAILKSHPEAELVGIVQLVDRQERGQQGSGSTVQEVEKEFNVPVVSIIALDDIVKYMEGREDMKDKLEQMKAYRAQWGITPQ
ncbi:orotate phosphoribosyltransferase [Naganishia cerealis]|uniref:Orotate phosphoribosyltransferase n=1 Tax=Naganishia cerealis TaxID=610337 RepID=A0ACC2UYY9_9TREE|nr:orotate phosphoribosyltransferase [Naganishia cerealis]